MLKRQPSRARVLADNDLTTTSVTPHRERHVIDPARAAGIVPSRIDIWRVDEPGRADARPAAVVAVPHDPVGNALDLRGDPFAYPRAPCVALVRAAVRLWPSPESSFRLR